MVRDNYKKNQKRKEFIIVTFACCLCLSAIAIGTSVINKKSDKTEKDTSNIVNLNETTNRLERDSEEETTENIAVDGSVNKETPEDNNTSGIKTDSSSYSGKHSQNDEKNSGENNQYNTQNGNDGTSQTGSDDEVKDVAGMVSKLSFGTDSKLGWPVEGSIILDYSMDSTIYFPTLDSYKCNPAIVIQSEAGTNVLAGVKGVVKEVSSNDEIGNYVVLALGNDYELTLGQLENVELKEGDMVNEDTCIGVVANPTRYYSNEGSNLYYELTKAEEPCDPLDYLS